MIKQQTTAQKTQQAKRKLNRKDFLFEDGWFETKVKPPKSLVMQQFQISDCQQCTILLLDSNACVYIDSCKYCTIFIGPSQSSIFIRDCESITVVSISQQFRVRDSFDCKFGIFCQSQPIIESSDNITFGCYPEEFKYEGLREQMVEAKLNEWNNNWFDVYDFTPRKFRQSGRNHQLAGDDRQFVGLKQVFMEQLKQHSVQQTNNVIIPTISGKLNRHTGSPYPIDQIIFLAITPCIQPHQALSPILQSRFIPISQEIQKIVNLSLQKTRKVLFLKIRKGDEARWRQCGKVVRVVKDEKEKEGVEGVVFAPFKDQH